MDHVSAFLSALALLAAAAPTHAQVLHERTYLEVRRNPFRLQWVNNLALEGPWLAAGGTDTEGFSGLALYRRDGTDWIPQDLPAGGDVDMDGNRLLLADTEGGTSVYRLEGRRWVLEDWVWAQFAKMHGNRMLSWQQTSTTPLGVTVNRLVAGAWLPEATLLPDVPQEPYTCCGNMELWGNTAVFTARGSVTPRALFVFVRERGRWRQEAELAPEGRSLGPIAIEGQTLVTGDNDAVGTTVIVRERELGTWVERARIVPGGYVNSMALEDGVLVLGSNEGVVRVYERGSGTWDLTAVLATRDGLSLGYSVAIEDRLVVAGSDPNLPPRLARVYVFQLPPR